MTDKLKARIDILYNQLMAKCKDENPHIRAGRTWEWWYSKHSYTVPIPKELLPTEEQYREWDRKEAEYITTHLTDYEAKLAYWYSMQNSPVADTIAGVIARTVPCECREAQCSVFCSRYGMENCRDSVIRK